ncbi:MAG: histidine phosphatase family protein [Candidatus Cybelea sp.]
MHRAPSFDALVLCRHAATDHNLAMRFLSTTDAPLSAHGRAQSERLRDAFTSFGFERCLVSPMRRCLETREIAVPELPFEIAPTLREVDFGEWEGQTLELVEERAPELVAARRRNPVAFRPPGGESIEDASARLRPLAERLRSHHAMLVIGHRISLGILERLLRDLPLESKDVAGLAPAEFRIVPA